MIPADCSCRTCTTEMTRAELELEIERRVSLGAGGAFHLVTLHDDHCCAPERECSCNPSFVLEELTAENYERGQRAERKHRADVRKRALSAAWRMQRGRA